MREPNRLTQKTAAQALLGSNNPDDLSEFIMGFYKRCNEIYYKMTSCQVFNKREEAIFYALAAEFEGINKRLSEIEAIVMPERNKDEPVVETQPVYDEVPTVDVQADDSDTVEVEV